MKASLVQFSFRLMIEQELNNQVREGIISIVNTCEWATPFIPDVKNDGGVRVSGDFKVTINKCRKLPTFKNRRYIHKLVTRSEIQQD